MDEDEVLALYKTATEDPMAYIKKNWKGSLLGWVLLGGAFAVGYKLGKR